MYIYIYIHIYIYIYLGTTLLVGFPAHLATSTSTLSPPEVCIEVQGGKAEPGIFRGRFFFGDDIYLEDHPS